MTEPLLDEIDEIITERDQALAENERLRAEAAVMREALSAVVHRCEAHCGIDGNPNWGEKSSEYHYLKQALSASAGADLLARVKKLERVTEAAKLRVTAVVRGNWSDRMVLLKELKAVLAELEGGE